VIRGSPRVNADSEILSGPGDSELGGGVGGPLTTWLSRAVERSAMAANVFRAETGILELYVASHNPGSWTNPSVQQGECLFPSLWYATIGCQKSGPWCDLILFINQMAHYVNCSQFLRVLSGRCLMIGISSQHRPHASQLMSHFQALLLTDILLQIQIFSAAGPPEKAWYFRKCYAQRTGRCSDFFVCFVIRDAMCYPRA